LLQTVAAVGGVVSTLSASTDTATLFNDLQAGLKAPLTGMGTAFGTSLFGLASSIVLGFCDLQAGQAQNRFYNDLEEWLSAQTRLSTGAIGGGEGGETVPAYIQALLETTADNLENLQRTMARAEDGRAASSSASLQLIDRLGQLADQMKAEQQVLLKLAEGQIELRTALVKMAEAPRGSGGAAMDDATAVWKELVKKHKPRNMAVFGTSTGGAMTLALVLRAKAEKLPIPAAIAPGTPWSDIAKIGDTYETNEWIDNVLVTWDGWLGRAAKLYAAGRDLKDPQLSPIYGDFAGFPPTILTSGTRDLFLSNTVRTHRKLRRAGVTADLHVYEGQSHAQYGFNADAPETKEAFTEIARFFDRHLGH
jgi:dienelactone hydrolase